MMNPIIIAMNTSFFISQVSTLSGNIKVVNKRALHYNSYAYYLTLTKKYKEIYGNYLYRPQLF